VTSLKILALLKGFYHHDDQHHHNVVLLNAISIIIMLECLLIAQSHLQMPLVSADCTEPSTNASRLFFFNINLANKTKKNFFITFHNYAGIQ
jgi:hypothetical protein